MRLAVALVVLYCRSVHAAFPLPEPLVLSSGWQLQDSSKVPGGGAIVSAVGYRPEKWYPAIVPGTVLTSLVAAKVYPEPLYGENNRPDRIPESLNKTPWWYRTTINVPKSFAKRRVWLKFDGINYGAEIWLNGQQVGMMRGAFIRGAFDVTPFVKIGKNATLAVLVMPQPHPGNPHEHTIAAGLGHNGGVTAADGPTFLSTIGWDWIPAIRDRDTGIWQKISLSATGPVLIKDPLITTDLPLPRTDAADVSVQTTLENSTDTIQRGLLKGAFGEVSFEQSVELAPHASQVVALNSKTMLQLHLSRPRLWWPNGYGPQNMYKLHLTFEQRGSVSDNRDISFGVRKITYAVSDSENLTLSVNGVRVFIRGGNWGLDEALKRIPRERLEAMIRMHQLANLNLIRNWVGQSTDEDFYDLCDQYGILLWDEFFQPNPADGPDPEDLKVYLANVRDKILHYRNHPSIALWCARNEGFPPKSIDDPLRTLMAELEPTRLYQPSSTDGRGVHSGGPYYWRAPHNYYVYEEAFKTEVGSVSIPTMESVQGMMPQKDWETINNDWAEHDLAKGAQHGDSYPLIMASRYGKVANLADFVRKGQLMNYEAFRAMYEGRNAKMFAPVTGVITWMSNPAQPSFVWQIYHHDLEPNASLFAVKKASEPVHIQVNESDWNIEVVNNHPEPIKNAKANLSVYDLDGKLAYKHDYEVNVSASSTERVSSIDWPTNLDSVHFIKVALHDSSGSLVSDNFYWRANAENSEDLSALNKLQEVTLDAEVARTEINHKNEITVTLHNRQLQVALMAHLQLRRQDTGERVLPVYYSDNYVSLVPNESKTITIEVASASLSGTVPLVVVDGWNINIRPIQSGVVILKRNENSQVSHWPTTGLPIQGGTQ